MRRHSDEVLTVFCFAFCLILPLLSDLYPKVRYAACQCVYVSLPAHFVLPSSRQHPSASLSVCALKLIIHPRLSSGQLCTDLEVRLTLNEYCGEL